MGWRDVEVDYDPAREMFIIDGLELEAQFLDALRRKKIEWAGRKSWPAIAREEISDDNG